VTFHHLEDSCYSPTSRTFHPPLQIDLPPAMSLCHTSSLPSFLCCTFPSIVVVETGNVEVNTLSAISFQLCNNKGRRVASDTSPEAFEMFTILCVVGGM